MKKELAALAFIILLAYSLAAKSGFMLFASLFGIFFSLLSSSDDELIFSSALGAFSLLFLSLMPASIGEKMVALPIAFLSIASVPTILFAYRKKLSVFKISALCVFLTILGYSSLSKAGVHMFGVERWTIIGLLIFMFYFAVLGMVAQTFQRMVVYSSAVQFLFAILDFEVGKLSGGTVFGTLRIMEYLCACIPFFAVLILASREGDYKGILRENNLLGLSFLVSCLSMAGVPAFSIFVSEFLLLSSSMAINKLLTLVIVFFVTLCFILYASYLFPALTPSKKTIKPSRLILWLCLLSALFTIAMGLSPSFQAKLVGVLRW